MHRTRSARFETSASVVAYVLKLLALETESTLSYIAVRSRSFASALVG
jgi:hypothetical protein